MQLREVPQVDVIARGDLVRALRRAKEHGRASRGGGAMGGASGGDGWSCARPCEEADCCAAARHRARAGGVGEILGPCTKILGVPTSTLALDAHATFGYTAAAVSPRPSFCRVRSGDGRAVNAAARHAVDIKLNALMAGFRKSARISVKIEYG